MSIEDDYNKLKEELESCENPLFIFDNDADGLCSFLQLYMHKGSGKGIPVRKSPIIDESYLRFLNYYKPDKVFILDVSNVEQDFIDSCQAPIVWVDHHDMLERNNITVINPKKFGKDYPVAYITYMAVKESLWLSALGCVADYHVPDFTDDVKEKYPGLIGEQTNTPDDLSHGTNLGILIDAFSFAIKGKPSDVSKYINALTKIRNPEDILEQETPAGKFVYRKYAKVRKFFDTVLEEIQSDIEKDNSEIIVYTYTNNDYSITADLANEIIHLYPDRIVIVARKYEGNYFMSIRSRKKSVKEPLQNALKGLDGHGGGHDLACGGAISEDDFSEFVERFRKNIE